MEEKTEHINRPDRQFVFHDKVTYIERQDITVQNGAIFYNGPAPQTENNEKTHIESHSMNVEEKIRYCVERLEKDAVINHKQDYAVILKVIKDKDIKCFNNKSFADFISAIDAVPQSHKPNESNIKMLTIADSSKFPNIKVVVDDEQKSKYYLDIANRFWALYSSLE